ncbi:MAG: hypothetical protein RL358_1323 [Pseudomonadota bacterium]|jgi:signal transduction histidine kinase
MSDANLLHSFFDNLPGMAFQIQLNGADAFQFNYVSSGCAAVLDLSTQQLTQSPHLMLNRIHNDDQQNFLSSMHMSIQNLAPWNWEGRIVVEPNNQVKWVNLRAACRKNAQQATLLDGFMVNITLNKQNELDATQAHQQLGELCAYLETIKEQERSRIARIIHDDIGVLLTALKLDLSWISQRLPREQPLLHEKSRAMLGLMDTAVNTVNTLIDTLHPSMLDYFGIAAAIEMEAREFTKRTQILCTLNKQSDDLELSNQQAITLFRACQEILNNIMARTGTHQVSIKLLKDDQQVSLIVADNGKDYDASNHLKQRDIGLRLVRQRIAQLSGELIFSSDSQQCVMVIVNLPLTSDSNTLNENFQPTLF